MRAHKYRHTQNTLFPYSLAGTPAACKHTGGQRLPIRQQLLDSWLLPHLLLLLLLWGGCLATGMGGRDRAAPHIAEHSSPGCRPLRPYLHTKPRLLVCLLGTRAAGCGGGAGRSGQVTHCRHFKGLLSSDGSSSSSSSTRGSRENRHDLSLCYSGNRQIQLTAT